MNIQTFALAFILLCSLALNAVFMFLIVPLKNATIRQQENTIEFYLRKLRAVYKDGFWMGWEWMRGRAHEDNTGE